MLDLRNNKKVKLDNKIEEWKTEFDKNNYEISLKQDSDNSNEELGIEIKSRGSRSKDLFMNNHHR